VGASVLLILKVIEMQKIPFKKYALGLAITAGSVSTFAAPPDYTALTGSIDFSTTTAAILAVAALLGVVLVSKKGAKMILGFIGR
jgi:hypothetical protein